MKSCSFVLLIQSFLFCVCPTLSSVALYNRWYLYLYMKYPYCVWLLFFCYTFILFFQMKTLLLFILNSWVFLKKKKKSFSIAHFWGVNILKQTKKNATWQNVFFHASNKTFFSIQFHSGHFATKNILKTFYIFKFYLIFHGEHIIFSHTINSLRLIDISCSNDENDHEYSIFKAINCDSSWKKEEKNSTTTHYTWKWLEYFNKIVR